MNFRGQVWIVLACFTLFTCAPHKTPAETQPPTRTRASQNTADPTTRKPHGSEDLPALEIFDLKRQGRYLMGTVRDERGLPLTGILIKAKGTDGAPPYTAVTKKDGSFFVTAPAGQAYVLIIDNPHFQKLTLRLSSKFGLEQP